MDNVVEINHSIKEIVNKNEPKAKTSLAWIIIQCTLDPASDNWESLMGEDVPDWVKDEERLGEMIHGKKMICWNPDSGFHRWYRALEVKRGATPPRAS